MVNVLVEIVRQNHKLKVGAQPNHSSDSFNKMLAKLAQVSGNNALVILIGDGHGWNNKSTDFIKKIRQHNEIIACHVHDPLEQELPEMPQMVVSDGEQQIQFSSHDAVIREKYKTELERQLNTYVETAKKYRIPLLSITTVLPVEQQLRKALGSVVVK